MYFLLHYHHWRLGQESCVYNNQFTMSLWQTSIRTHVSSLVLSSPSPPSLPPPLRPPHSLPLPLPLHRCQGSPAIVSGENCPKSAISKMVCFIFINWEKVWISFCGNRISKCPRTLIRTWFVYMENMLVWTHVRGFSDGLIRTHVLWISDGLTWTHVLGSL